MSSMGSGVWSPWRKPKRLQQQQQLEDKHVYDLYAVCNHHGKDLQGGHYTGEFFSCELCSKRVVLLN
jgi:ubiquitin carboxyl-terminal hydrolase 31